MPETFADDYNESDNPLSKSAQLRRSPGGNRICPVTGEFKSECQCRPCINSRNRKSGLKAQRRDGRQLAKGLGRRPGLLNNEETTNWPIRWEAKSGQAAKKVWAFYEMCEAQADAATPIGSKYPMVAVADGLAVLKVEDFRRLLNEAKRGTL